MEAAFGGSFAAVRVHEDAYAQAIGALAFTRGMDIFFAPGRFDPGSPQGLELLGHELTHVKQQAEGRVAVNAQIGGAPANNDRPDGIEIHLPRCQLYVTEGFESNMDLKFLPESTGLDRSVSIADALGALRKDPKRLLPPRPRLIDYFSPHASLDKVKNELRDLFTLVFTYFLPSLSGDFDWLAAYRAHGGEPG